MRRQEALQAQRQHILRQIEQLEQMRRGSLTEQFVEAVKADGSRSRRGPYPLYTYKDKNRTISRRVSDPQLLPLYRDQIQAFRRFQELSAELTRLGEELSDLAIPQDGVKKNRGDRRRQRPGGASAARDGGAQ